MSRTMKALLGVWILALAAAAGWIGWDAWQRPVNLGELPRLWQEMQG